MLPDSGAGKEALAVELAALGIGSRALAAYAPPVTATAPADEPQWSANSRPTTASSRPQSGVSRPATASRSPDSKRSFGNARPANAPAADAPQYERQTFLVPGASMAGVPKSPYAKVVTSTSNQPQTRDEMKKAASELAVKEERRKRRERAASMAHLSPEERVRREQAKEAERRRQERLSGVAISKSRSSISLESQPESMARLTRSASANPGSLRVHTAVAKYHQRRGEPTPEEARAAEDLRLFRERMLV